MVVTLLPKLHPMENHLKLQVAHLALINQASLQDLMLLQVSMDLAHQVLHH